MSSFKLGTGSSQSSCTVLSSGSGNELVHVDIRPGQRHVERDAAAVGVTDEMDLAFAFVDERDAAGSFVRERKCALARPRPRAFIAKVLGGQQLIAATQRFRQVGPLAGTGARAM